MSLDTGTCGTCIHFTPIPDDVVHGGTCRRYPATYYKTTGDRCGEHREDVQRRIDRSCTSLAPEGTPRPGERCSFPSGHSGRHASGPGIVIFGWE